MSKQMKFTDLEVGDRLLILDGARDHFVEKGCGCNYCSMLDNRVTVEAEVIEVLEINEYLEMIRVVLSNTRWTTSVWINSKDIDKFKISYVSGV